MLQNDNGEYCLKFLLLWIQNINEKKYIFWLTWLLCINKKFFLFINCRLIKSIWSVTPICLNIFHSRVCIQSFEESFCRQLQSNWVHYKLDCIISANESLAKASQDLPAYYAFGGAIVKTFYFVPQNSLLEKINKIWRETGALDKRFSFPQ